MQQPPHPKCITGHPDRGLVVAAKMRHLQFEEVALPNSTAIARIDQMGNTGKEVRTGLGLQGAPDRTVEQLHRTSRGAASDPSHAFGPVLPPSTGPRL